MLFLVCLLKEMQCAETKSRILKRRRAFAGGMGLSGVRTQGVTLFSLRHQSGFGTPTVSKGRFARPAVIRRRLLPAFSPKTMPESLSLGTGAVSVRAALKNT